MYKRLNFRRLPKHDSNYILSNIFVDKKVFVMTFRKQVERQNMKHQHK